ncbi:MAG: ferrous iron transport protein B [Acidobacteria bacterium]|nr:MAG: ferrous iron transport protein B [Acidobacteriota bacterium]
MTTKTQTQSNKSKEATSLRIAVAGNPNTGKSTLINSLAGSSIQVGNWPGVTVEKREATIKAGPKTIHLIDLPGIYKLSDQTAEERVASCFLLEEKPDLILNVIDSTNLERNLNLTLQLQELGVPMLIALNMSDEAESKGIQIDTDKLERILNAKVVKTIATSKKSVRKLKEHLWLPLSFPKQWTTGSLLESHHLIFEKLHESECPFPLTRCILQFLDGEPKAVNQLQSMEEVDHELFTQWTALIKENQVTDARYSETERISKEVLVLKKSSKPDWTDKLDSIVLNRFLGIPVFFFLMWLVFKMTFDISGPFVDWIDVVTTGPLTRWTELLLNLLSAPEWVISLGTEGLIGGVGFVLAFTPVIFAIMFFMSVLEGSGYMARVAFIMDQYMQKIGLPGKAFIPLLLGFGCNVPSVYATRTLDSNNDRILTCLISPFMSCGARLPVYILFIAAFFPGHSGTVLWGIYTLGLVLAVVTGILFRKLLFKSEPQPFLLELPPYRVPLASQLAKETWEKGKHFLQKAGTFILGVSILVWFMFNLPWGVENPKDSVLGKMGHMVSPVLQPLGFGTWEAGASLITGVVAKEIVVGTMGEIYAHQEEEETRTPTFKEEMALIGSGFVNACLESGQNLISTIKVSALATDKPEGGLVQKIQKVFTPLQALSFMIFVLTYMPCAVTGIAMKQEFGTWKWYGIAIIAGLVLGWLISFIVYQGGLLMGIGS